jgi:hypothetical protein
MASVWASFGHKKLLLRVSKEVCQDRGPWRPESRVACTLPTTVLTVSGSRVFLSRESICGTPASRRQWLWAIIHFACKIAWLETLVNNKWA